MLEMIEFISKVFKLQMGKNQMKTEAPNTEEADRIIIVPKNQNKAVAAVLSE